MDKSEENNLTGIYMIFFAILAIIAGVYMIYDDNDKSTYAISALGGYFILIVGFILLIVGIIFMYKASKGTLKC